MPLSTRLWRPRAELSFEWQNPLLSPRIRFADLESSALRLPAVKESSDGSRCRRERDSGISDTCEEAIFRELSCKVEAPGSVCLTNALIDEAPFEYSLL